MRANSPSAENRSKHSSRNFKNSEEKHKNVLISRIEGVGNYAIRIIFDDGHDTGIYSWVYLRKMSEKNAELYRDYLNRVKKII